MPSVVHTPVPRWRAPQLDVRQLTWRPPSGAEAVNESTGARLPSGADPLGRWFTLFCITRAATAVVAPLLLTLQGLEGREVLLSACAILYGALTVAATVRWPSLRTHPGAWLADVVAVLALIVAFGNWRSPFYLLALTALILPTTALAPRRALCFGVGFVLAFFAAALYVGIDWNAIATTARVQSLFAHLLVPLLVTAALTFGAELLRALERERRRSERLALEAERRRIAWELHDSAKQHVHAARVFVLCGRRHRANYADCVAMPMRGSAREEGGKSVALRSEPRPRRACGDEQDRHAVTAETCFAENAGVRPSMRTTIAIRPSRACRARARPLPLSASRAAF